MKPENAAHEPVRKQPHEAVLATFQDIGHLLAEGRREQNLSIKQVADKIHIRQQYLISLEQGQLSELPGWVYIFGFIRIYARLLNLDGEELIRRLQTLPKLPSPERSQIPTPLPSEEGPNFLTLTVSAALIFLIAIGGYFFLKPTPPHPSPLLDEVASDEPANPQTDETALPPLAGAEKNVTEKNGPETQLPDAPSPPLPLKAKENLSQPLSPKKMTVKASEPSWIEIRNPAGHIIFMKVLKKGEEYVIPDKPGVTLSTGNAGGIDLFIGDTKLPPLGSRGDVKHGIRLETLQ